MKTPEISIIVPCLNEEQNIPILVEKLQDILNCNNFSYEILIVDNCSDDSTFKEALSMQHKYPNVKALHKGLPRGIGSGIRYGIQQAQGEMGIVVMGDCVDPLEAIPDFRKKIIEEKYDLALLSRYLNPKDSSNIPLSYKFYQWCYRFLCRNLLGVTIRDITYAYRAFSLPFIRQMNLQSNGFEISPETTLKAWLNGGKIAELQGRQGRRFAGESKFIFSEQGLGYASVLAKAIIKRITGIWI